MKLKKRGGVFWRRSFPFWEKFWPKIQGLSLDRFGALPLLELILTTVSEIQLSGYVYIYIHEILWVRWESFSIYQQYIYGKIFPFHMANIPQMFIWKNIPLWDDRVSYMSNWFSGSPGSMRNSQAFQIPGVQVGCGVGCDWWFRRAWLCGRRPHDLCGKMKGALLNNLPSRKLTFSPLKIDAWEATFLFRGAMLVQYDQWSVAIEWMAEINHFLETLKVYKSPKGRRMHVSSDIHGYHPYKFTER